MASTVSKLLGWVYPLFRASLDTNQLTRDAFRCVEGASGSIAVALEAYVGDNEFTENAVV